MSAIKILLAALAALMVLGGLGMAETAATTVTGSIATSISVSAPAAVAWDLGQSNTDNQKLINVVVLANDPNAAHNWKLTSAVATAADQYLHNGGTNLGSQLYISGGILVGNVLIGTATPDAKNTIISTGVTPTATSGTTVPVTLHQATTTSDVPGSYSTTITFTVGYN